MQDQTCRHARACDPKPPKCGGSTAPSRPPVCLPSGGGGGPVTLSGRRHDGRGAAILILLHLVLKRGVDPGDTEAAICAMQEAAHAAIFLLKPAGIVTVRITERAAVKIQGLLSFMADEARTSCHGSPLLCVQADDESTKARIRAVTDCRACTAYNRRPVPPPWKGKKPCSSCNDTPCSLAHETSCC